MNEVILYLSSGIAIIISIITLFRSISQDNSKLLERVTALETKTDLFWVIVEKNIISLVKSPTHLEKDLLLDKIVCNEKISHEELNQLKSYIRNDIDHLDKENVGKVLLYSLILGRLEQRISDFQEAEKK